MLIKKPQKILCLLQLPPPTHGVSIMNNYVINSVLLKSNFNLNVINLNFAQSIKGLGKFSFQKVIKAIIFCIKIIKNIITQKPDLVYFSIAPVGFAFYRDVFYVLIIKLLNKKLVFHIHGKGINKNSKKNIINKSLYRYVFKNTQVICLSKNLSSDLKEVYKSTPFIVPNGIKVLRKHSSDLDKYSGSIPNILYLSNFKRDKGILILLEALDLLQSKGYNFKAKFIGAPFDISFELLEKHIHNRNLTELIKLSGPIYDENKKLEFQQADIFVFPTYNDAFPLVILEAMQYSLPIISTFEGGIPEIVIDNETGFLVEPKNHQMLADKIAILLKDKNLRIRFGKNGYERFKKNYTLSHFENNMKNTFQTILNI